VVQPDFIIIPTPVLLDERLQPGDRVLYGYIRWLTKLQPNGKCTASNTILAELTISTPRNVQQSLIHLERAGWVKRILGPAGINGKGLTRVEIKVVDPVDNPVDNLGKSARGVLAGTNRGVSKTVGGVLAGTNQNKSINIQSIYTEHINNRDQNDRGGGINHLGLKAEQSHQSLSSSFPGTVDHNPVAGAPPPPGPLISEKQKANRERLAQMKRRHGL
jgi:hypothetical protein